MTVDEIIKYVMETPHNTNKAVLKPMLESLAGEGEEEPSQDITLTTLEATSNQTYTAPENTAYNQVNVKVQPSSMQQFALQITNLTEGTSSYSGNTTITADCTLPDSGTCTMTVTQPGRITYSNIEGPSGTSYSNSQEEAIQININNCMGTLQNLVNFLFSLYAWKEADPTLELPAITIAQIEDAGWAGTAE